MNSFPPMSSLPTWLDTTGWKWRQVQRSGHASDGFWIGTDCEGREWITKLNRSFYAYREIVFARLAQAMGWSCQSSIFIRLDLSSAATLGCDSGEVHSAHWLMAEHDFPPCGSDCPLETLTGAHIGTPQDLYDYNIKHLIDCAKVTFAAYIFGANEPSDRFFTTAHEFVIIDSEQMFSTCATSFKNERWLKLPDGSTSPSGIQFAVEVCNEIAALTPDQINQALSIPAEIEVELSWPILPKIQSSIEFAKDYVAQNEGRI